MKQALSRLNSGAVTLVRLYLGGLFVFASVHKIAHPASFALDVATYQMLPLWSINAFAIIVPWLELLAGALLIAGVRVPGAALAVMGLMAAFIAALGWALAHKLDVSCGCFASQAAREQDPISWRTMVRDAVWIGMALYVLLGDRRPLGLERWFAGKPR
jgi:putative oxidoreductase